MEQPRPEHAIPIHVLDFMIRRAVTGQQEHDIWKDYYGTWPGSRENFHVPEEKPSLSSKVRGKYVFSRRFDNSAGLQSARSDVGRLAGH